MDLASAVGRGPGARPAHRALRRLEREPSAHADAGLADARADPPRRAPAAARPAADALPDGGRFPARVRARQPRSALGDGACGRARGDAPGRAGLGRTAGDDRRGGAGRSRVRPGRASRAPERRAARRGAPGGGCERGGPLQPGPGDGQRRIGPRLRRRWTRRRRSRAGGARRRPGRGRGARAGDVRRAGAPASGRGSDPGRSRAARRRGLVLHEPRDAGARGRALAYRGTHGHRSNDPRLHAAFLAAGPSIVGSARTGVLDQLDVAPTIASILGVRLAAAERTAAPSVLRRL